MAVIPSTVASGLVHILGDVGKAGVNVVEKGAKETGNLIGGVIKDLTPSKKQMEEWRKIDRTPFATPLKNMPHKLHNPFKKHSKLKWAELGGVGVIAWHESHKDNRRAEFEENLGVSSNSNGRSTATTLNKFSKDSTKISGTGLQNQASSEKTQTAEAQR